MQDPDKDQKIVIGRNIDSSKTIDIEYVLHFHETDTTQQFFGPSEMSYDEASALIEQLRSIKPTE